MTERLSLCLIVKDEADMLPGFLASVSGLWDELIAVDTGLVDATAELLRHAGAKVLHRPWTQDFAAARNHSLDAASGDWILVLDADERCSPEFVTAVRALLCRADVGAATVKMRNVREDGHVHEARLLRMFRRSDVYAKTRKSSVTGAIIAAGSLESLATETLIKLGVQVLVGSAAAAYNRGETTQLPGRFVANTGQRRISRKIAVGGRALTYENNYTRTQTSA